MRRTAFLLTTLVSLNVPALTAQGPTVGQRVRLTANAVSFIGTVIDDRGDSLWLQVVDRAGYGGRMVAVARRSITQVEISRGRHSKAGDGALIGLGIGMLVGAAWGAVDASQCTGWCIVSPEAAAVGGAVVLGGAGALVGAAIGAGNSSERWEIVSAGRAHLRLAPSGAGIAVALRF